MNREYVLAILYELALVMSGETRVAPLIQKTLQRLMYHTGFPCGVYISRPFSTGTATVSGGLVEAVLGNRELAQGVGRVLNVPDAFFESDSRRVTLPGDLQFLSPIDRYSQALCLPVSGDGVFVLLAAEPSASQLPVTAIFAPVLANFAKVILLCRQNESYTETLKKEIEERKRAEEQLYLSREQAKQARDEAEAANRAKSVFLSRMSHELRTPMNAVLGFAQMLEMTGKDRLSGNHQAWVHEILSAGRHLLQLINEVLDLARIESGKLVLTHETVAVGPLAEECLTLVSTLAADKGIELINAIAEEDQSRAVWADRVRLKQALINLLSNAIKYNNKNGSVTLGCQLLASGVLRLQVEDTGIGIKTDEIRELFTPFHRLPAGQLAADGTGIGLVITRHLMRAMGGSVGVESREGEGSRFWLDFPLQAEAEASVGDAHAVERGTDVAATDGAPLRVLYVEDNLSNVRLLSDLFGSWTGVQLQIAQTGRMAIELATAAPPDLILLDIRLPDIDGYAVKRALQQYAGTAHIPVIAVTADAMNSDLARGKQAGFAGYVTKPIDVPVFMETLENMFQQIRTDKPRD